MFEWLAIRFLETVKLASSSSTLSSSSSFFFWCVCILKIQSRTSILTLKYIHCQWEDIWNFKSSRLSWNVNKHINLNCISSTHVLHEIPVKYLFQSVFATRIHNWLESNCQLLIPPLQCKDADSSIWIHLERRNINQILSWIFFYVYGFWIWNLRFCILYYSMFCCEGYILLHLLIWERIFQNLLLPSRMSIHSLPWVSIDPWILLPFPLRIWYSRPAPPEIGL